jgi:1-acyl-sn-glycerol-3-phosphate acyltransferase
MNELAPMREQVYADTRPKEYFDGFHTRARTREPDWIYEFVRVLVSLYAYTLLRARPIAPGNVPGSGAVILAPNHFSFMDHFLVGCYLRRKMRFMAKSQLFKPPMQFVYTHGGVFPVRRGAHDDDTFITAETILGKGGCVTMYCEGGRSRSGKVSERAKPGIGRLALETGAPVVPIALFGSSRIRNWKRLQFPRVTIQYGEPICWERVSDPSREQQQAVADTVLAEIRRMYAGLEQYGRKGIRRHLRAQRRAERAERSRGGAPKGAAA